MDGVQFRVDKEQEAKQRQKHLLTVKSISEN